MFSILMFELYTYNDYERIIEGKIHDILENNLEMISTKIVSVYNDMVEFSNIIMINEKVLNELREINDGSVNNLDVKDVKSILLIHNEIMDLQNNYFGNLKADVTIVSKKGIVCNVNYSYTSSSINNEIEPQIISNKSEHLQYDFEGTSFQYLYMKPFTYKNIEGEYITIAREIIDNNEVIGYIIINAIESEFFNIIRKNDWQSIYLYDQTEENRIFLYGNSNIKSENLLEVEYNNWGDWKLVAKADKDYLMKENFEVKQKIIIYNIILLTFFVILIVLSIMRITNPLKKLVEKISNSRIGNYKIGTDKEVDLSDVDSLVNVYDGLFNRIDELANRIIEDGKKESDLKYTALQNQINPHFLLNTLNNIKFSAMINGEKNIEQMTTELGNLLEATLYKSEEILISEEIGLIKSYMFIQNLRFNNSFDLKLELEENILNFKIIKMILQPIVENSILHGFKDRDYGNILIRGYERDNDILIEIIDDGVGFNGNLKLIKKERDKKKYSGIGMDNVDERLKLKFGEKYGISIDKVDNGAKIVVLFPKRR